MKVIFGGTPEFAAVALDALIAAGFEVALVLTRPDRPAGRGLRLRPSPVKQRSIAAGLPLAQPVSLKDAALQEQLRAARAEAMVVAAYGLLLPPAVLALPPRGCLNIHASLLPRWRGAAPIERALLAGDRATGITIMQMDPGLDTGAILLQEQIAIAEDDNAQTLHDKLAQLGAGLIVRALNENPVPRAQDEALATYAGKVSKAEAAIDWTQSATEIDRQIRAFNPAPGATAVLEDTTLKIWQARPTVCVPARPGTIVAAAAAGIVVAAGVGAISISELQKAGGKRLGAGAFLAGAGLAAGARFQTRT